MPNLAFLYYHLSVDGFGLIAMIVFFPPILEHFSTNWDGSHWDGSHADGSHVAQMGSHCAQNATTNPYSLLSCQTHLSGICTCTKHPQAHPKTPIFLV